jgi:hypothetical protein
VVQIGCAGRSLLDRFTKGGSPYWRSKLDGREELGRVEEGTLNK